MSVIQAGNTTTTSLIYTGDTTGNLVFTTGGANTVALTLSNTQSATFANSVAISGSTSGAVTLAVPAVAGSNTVTIPSSTGNVLLDSTTGVCRAWVYFNGSTGAIRNSFNVANVTRISTGYYTITMTNATPTANYAITGSARETSTNGLAVVVPVPDLFTPTTTSFRIQVIGSSSFNLQDSLYTSVIVFG